MKRFAIIVTAALSAAVLPAPMAAEGPTPPPGAEKAEATLAASPRHGEYVDVKVPDSDQKVLTWVVYPERAEKAPVVIVIHEIFGLTDWIRSVADRLAADGYIAVAPDLLTGKAPDGAGTSGFGSRDDVVRAIRNLPDEEVASRLDAVRAHALALPAASGRSATIGFCWGGSTSFAYATHQSGLNAAIVYYGSSPDADRLARLKVPVLGLYGGDDARVNATIDPARETVSKQGGAYETEIYEGAGHGFLRAQADRDGANAKAALSAWPRTLAFLEKHTR